MRVEHGGCANAVGAAIAQVSGEVDQVFQGLTRGEAIAAARKMADGRAIEAGAGAATLVMVEAEDTPIAYLPGNAMRVRVKVVGDIKSKIHRRAIQIGDARDARSLSDQHAQARRRSGRTTKPGCATRDYALVRSLPNYVSYKVHRIRPPIQGAERRCRLAIYRADRGQGLGAARQGSGFSAPACNCAKNSMASSSTARRTSISPATRSNDRSTSASRSQAVFERDTDDD